MRRDVIESVENFETSSIARKRRTIPKPKKKHSKTEDSSSEDSDSSSDSDSDSNSESSFSSSDSSEDARIVKREKITKSRKPEPVQKSDKNMKKEIAQI